MIRKAWIDKEKRRFYRISLFQDLLGSYVTLRVWGCLDTQQGSSLQNVLNSYEEGIKLISEVSNRRLQTGYSLTEECYEQEHSALGYAQSNFFPKTVTPPTSLQTLH